MRLWFISHSSYSKRFCKTPSHCGPPSFQQKILSPVAETARLANRNSLSFLARLMSFLPILVGKMALLRSRSMTLHMPLRGHLPTCSVLHCTGHSILYVPSLFLRCLHNSQVEEPRFNPLLPTMHHHPLLAIIFLERTVTFSHQLLHPYPHLQLFSTHLNHSCPSLH